MLKQIATALALAAATLTGTHAGDAQGLVSRVTIVPVYNGKHTLRIHLKELTKDRFGCIDPGKRTESGSATYLGYLEITDANPYVDADNIKQAMAMALSASAQGIPLHLDSHGGSGDYPCRNITSLYLEP